MSLDYVRYSPEIEVVDPEQPLTVVGSRLEVAAYCRDHGAEVQRPGWRRREPPAIGNGCRHGHRARRADSLT